MRQNPTQFLDTMKEALIQRVKETDERVTIREKVPSARSNDRINHKRGKHHHRGMPVP
jgi:hypothetical protein